MTRNIQLSEMSVILNHSSLVIATTKKVLTTKRQYNGASTPHPSLLMPLSQPQCLAFLNRNSAGSFCPKSASNRSKSALSKKIVMAARHKVVTLLKVIRPNLAKLNQTISPNNKLKTENQLNLMLYSL